MKKGLGFNDETKNSSQEIIDTYFHRERVAPSDRWRPKHCVLRSVDDDGNTVMAEKVDYLKHASLVHPLSGLVMLEVQADDVGSLWDSKTHLKFREGSFLSLR